MGCELGLQAGDLLLFCSLPSSRYLSIPSPPEPSSPLSLGMDNGYPLSVYHLLTSLLSLGMDSRYPWVSTISSPPWGKN